MNQPASTTAHDTKLLILGLLSLLLWPFTAVPGIIMGRRQRPMSSRGRFGYVLCWICLILFGVHLLIVASLLLQGAK